MRNTFNNMMCTCSIMAATYVPKWGLLHKKQSEKFQKSQKHKKTEKCSDFGDYMAWLDES